MNDWQPTVSNVMSTQLYTVSPYSTIKDAYDLLMDHDLRALPVVGDEGELVGIISERDIIRYRTRNILPKHADFYIKVQDVMTSSVNSFQPGLPLGEAAKKFVKWGNNQVPVVEDEVVVGIVEHIDLLSFFSDQWDSSANQMEGANIT
ncbi:MAG: HPP family protein [bacterium]